eukprot:3959938-Amphidinium_carterae.1
MRFQVTNNHSPDGSIGSTQTVGLKTRQTPQSAQNLDLGSVRGVCVCNGQKRWMSNGCLTSERPKSVQDKSGLIPESPQNHLPPQTYPKTIRNMLSEANKIEQVSFLAASWQRHPHDQK